MIDHKAAKELAVFTKAHRSKTDIADAYLDLRRLVKEYFKSGNTPLESLSDAEDFARAESALRAVIGEE